MTPHFPILARCASSLARPVPRIPQHRGPFQTPADFLKAIGRQADTKLKLADGTSWEGFFKLKGVDMKAAGVNVKDRRYILWSMQKFRMGQEPNDFKHEPRPKKKVRGWGPQVSPAGILLRSRRHRLPKAQQLQMTMHKLVLPAAKATPTSPKR